MHQLIKATHRHELPYTSATSPDVWDGLLATDTDATGQLIHLIYADKDVAATPYDSGSCDSWNREHLWSRSRGVGDTGMDNTDLHHMRPADCNVNAARSNRYFAQCGTVDLMSSCVSPAHLEAADDTERDTKSFLPPASKRGDIARAILYMDLRYDGDDPNTENLVASDCPENVPNGAGMGYLSQLLQWHLDDPPDEEERNRNGEICTNWQGNRNPFVDYPELATTYFGTPQPLPQDGAGYVCPDGPTTPTPTNAPTNLPSASLIITGVIDGPLSGGLPKAIELYATADIPDLSSYGVGFANNGGGTDGIEFTFPSQSASAGSFITIASEQVGFQAYFGVLPDFVEGSAIINGDDAIELFFDGQVIDVFGDVNVAGGEWNYMDGWSYRHDYSSPSSMFNIAEWILTGINAIDSCTSNAACASAFPFHTYQHSIVSPTSPPTLSPTPQPTEAPVTAPPTPNPTNSVMPPPTNPPVVTTTVDKYVCTKTQPLPATICAEGLPAGGSCSIENRPDGCGNGGKVCWWHACPTSGSPPPPPAPTPPAPTPSNCSPVGTFCTVDNECCSRSCPRKGKNSFTCA